MMVADWAVWKADPRGLCWVEMTAYLMAAELVDQMAVRTAEMSVDLLVGK